MRFLALIFCCLFFVFACNTDQPQPQPNPQPIKDTAAVVITPKIEQLKGMPSNLRIISNGATIYANPDIESAVLTQLNQGDSTVFTNQITTTTSTHTINNILHKEPWLRVILEDNQMGWIQGGYVSFDATQNEALKEKVLQTRAANLFGSHLAQLINIYTKEQQKIQTVPAFRLLYTRSETLKDSIEFRLNNWLKTNHKTGQPSADFFWINQLVEGLLLHYIPDSNQYFLFRDLKKWQKYSQGSSSLEDDAFVEIGLAAYQFDSIEYTLFDWQMSLDNGIVCSTLGEGKYLNVLDKIGVALDSSSYFESEIEEIKQAIINDISASNHYWLSLETILGELEAILARKYSFLDDNAIVELKTKMQLIQNYKKHKIQVNLFEGN